MIYNGEPRSVCVRPEIVEEDLLPNRTALGGRILEDASPAPVPLGHFV